MDGRFNRARQGVPDNSKAWQPLAEPAGNDCLRSWSGVRRFADQHFVHDAAERVDVGAAIDGLAQGLLGTHIGRRADGETGLGQPRSAGIADGACDSEIGNEDLVARKENVLRLDVTVHQAFAIGVVERLGDLAGDVDGGIERQLRLPNHPTAERLAVDVRHDVVEAALRFARSRRNCPRIEEAHHAGMIELRGDLDFTEKAFCAENRGEVRTEDLDGDLAVANQVVGQIDPRHAARADFPLDPVAISQGGGEPHAISHDSHQKGFRPSRMSLLEGKWDAAELILPQERECVTGSWGMRFDDRARPRTRGCAIHA